MHMSQICMVLVHIALQEILELWIVMMLLIMVAGGSGTYKARHEIHAPNNSNIENKRVRENGSLPIFSKHCLNLRLDILCVSSYLAKWFSVCCAMQIFYIDKLNGLFFKPCVFSCRISIK